MSKYTTEVRFICENAAGLAESDGYSGIDDILDKAREKVFDFEFPIFDENYRSVLENKILKHYYTREIGAESVGLWKLWLNTRLNEIMPYYNKLYESELIKFNPIYDVDLTTDYQKVDNGTNNKVGSYSENGDFSETTERDDETDSTTSDARKNDHWDYYSATPESGINGVADLKYLTDARHITDDGTGSTSTTNSTLDSDTQRSGETSKTGNTTDNTTIKNVEDYLHHVVGKSGGVSYSKMLKEFRSTFLNIDLQVINELRDLFMNVW